MSSSELFEAGVNDALVGRRPCPPQYAWGSDILIAAYMSGYRSIG